MAGFKQTMSQLNEAFDSAPYDLSMSKSPKGSDIWFNFEADGTEYRIKFATKGGLGKKARVVTIGQMQGKTFKDVLKQFKNNNRVIATLIAATTEYIQTPIGRKVDGLMFELSVKASPRGVKLLKTVLRRSKEIKARMSLVDVDIELEKGKGTAFLVRRGRDPQEVFDGSKVAGLIGKDDETVEDDNKLEKGLESLGLKKVEDGTFEHKGYAVKVDNRGASIKIGNKWMQIGGVNPDFIFSELDRYIERDQENLPKLDPKPEPKPEPNANPVEAIEVDMDKFKKPAAKDPAGMRRILVDHLVSRGLNHWDSTAIIDFAAKNSIGGIENLTWVNDVLFKFEVGSELDMRFGVKDFVNDSAFNRVVEHLVSSTKSEGGFIFNRDSYDELLMELYENPKMNFEMSRRIASSLTNPNVNQQAKNVIDAELPRLLSLCGERLMMSLNELVYVKDRAHYSPNHNIINVGNNLTPSVLWHEVGHAIEDAYPEVFNASKAMLIKGMGKAERPEEPVQDMGHTLTGVKGEWSIYKPHDHAYVTRVYYNRPAEFFLNNDPTRMFPEEHKELIETVYATEILSMGLQHFHSAADAEKLFNRDPALFEYTVKVLKYIASKEDV